MLSNAKKINARIIIMYVYAPIIIQALLQLNILISTYKLVCPYLKCTSDLVSIMR
jgi:hypothetical protein